MGKEARLIKNTIVLLIGTIGTKIVNYIMLPLLTGWLSVEEYGEVDVFTTIVSMVIPIVTLQLDQAIFRFLIDDKSYDEQATTISTGILFVLIVFFVADIPAAIFLSFNRNTLYALYVLAINIQGYYVIIQQIARGLGKNITYSINSIILAVVNMACQVILIYNFQLGTLGYIIAFCISNTLCIIFMMYGIRLCPLICFRYFSKSKLHSLLIYSLPMIVNNASWWILNASDKLMLNYFIGSAANGIYAAAGKIPGLIIVFYNVFQMAWQESTAREDSSNAQEFYSSVFRKLFAFMSYMTICLLICNDVLFGILIDGKFSEAINHMPILILALFFQCIAQFYGGIYVGMKKSKELGLTSALAAIINLAIDFAFMRYIGIYAASLSTLAAYFVLLIIRFFSVKKLCDINYKIREILITLVLVAFSIPISYSRVLTLSIAYFLIVSIIMFLIYKDVFQMMWSQMLSVIGTHRTKK